ncbi:MAG TPA: hypothetical protein PJ988_20410, partial [Anaerolinea sp.]|nr:hypothetical protein [Anaerolinea sp.]
GPAYPPQSTLQPGEPTRTPTRTLTATPKGGASGGENSRDASDWISLVMGLLMSGIVIFGLAWFFFLRPKTPAV